MFGQLKDVEIKVENRTIRRSDIFEKGKIDKRIQFFIEELRKYNSNISLIREERTNYISLNEEKIAVLRTYSSRSNSVGFSINIETVMEYPVIAIVFIQNSNIKNLEIGNIYLVPKGYEELPESGKISGSELQAKGFEIANINDLIIRLSEGGAANGTEL